MNTPSEKELTNENTNPAETDFVRAEGEKQVVDKELGDPNTPDYVLPANKKHRKHKKHRSHHSSHHSSHSSHSSSSSSSSASQTKPDREEFVRATGEKTHTAKEPVPEQNVREDVRLEGEKTHTPKDPVAEDNVREDIRLVGEKTPVQKDATTVRDEVQDFIYLKPRRKKKRHRSRSKSNSIIKRVNRRRKKRKKMILGVAAGLLAGILLMLGAFAFLLWKGQNDMLADNFQITAPDYVQVDDGGRYVVYNGHTYRLNESVANMLLMGVDKTETQPDRNNGTSGQADVIVLMAYDTKYDKITLINIPRDLMTDVPVYTPGGSYSSTQRQQICLAYAYGDGKEKSCENTVTVVERLFYNMPVKTYFAMDIDGIVPINDSIGGVDVVSPETIASFEEGKEYHLMGKQAESFVRSREHDTAQGNLKRNERQKVYAASFMSTLMAATKKNISTPVNLFNASSPYSVTNLNPSKVTWLAKEMITGGSPQTEMKSIEGTTTIDGNYAEFNYDEKTFYELFLSVYYEMVK